MLSSKLTRLSFVIPVKDEEETLSELAEGIFAVVERLDGSYDCEIVFVDDGSTDGSWEEMTRLVREFGGRVTALRLRRNFGKAMALQAGFRKATGEILFTMDADLQDDPEEIPRFLEALENGFDLVSGWKRVRQDPPTKTLPSRVFNKVTAWATGVELHDFNCGFKCYRREIIDSVQIYGELHRYIPVLAHDLGFRIGEIEVRHRPRTHGESKYGLERYVRGFIDLITVLATTRWLSKPGHLFGGIGIAFGLIGAGALLYLAVIRVLGGDIAGRPLLVFGVMLSILSVQMISLGVIAEFFIRSQGPREVGNLIAEVSEKPHRPSVTRVSDGT